MRTIFHLDMDTFFVSVERIINPKLKNKPVIVGGDPHGRGVVAACSYEARKFGLHSAMPIRTAFKLCPQGIYLHGHYDEYVRYSKAVKNLLCKYAPVLEQASIDEFYIDFTGCEHIFGPYPLLGSKIQKEINNDLSLPCSIGVASNKTLAKIASDFGKPNGITYVPPGEEKKFLAPLKVQVIPGVGKVTLKSLNERGIYYIKGITELPQDYFTTAFGKYGTDLWEKANGRGTEYLSVEREQKSISHETTFLNDVLSMKKIEETLFDLAAKLSQSLKEKKWIASTITFKLRYSDFKTLTKARTIKHTDDPAVIYNTIKDLFEKSYTRRVAIRLVGIRLTNFLTSSEQQFLFEDTFTKRARAIDAINKIRYKYGYSSIQFGTF
ncbi:MAG TPA: DNA polymerase IV [Ignavibacteriaceae bacterium]|nr:DNA polymerase IV [Ignavibacteriaceae bacterium]